MLIFLFSFMSTSNACGVQYFFFHFIISIVCIEFVIILDVGTIEIWKNVLFNKYKFLSNNFLLGASLLHTCHC